MKQMRDEKADIFIFQAESSTQWKYPQTNCTHERKEDLLFVKKKVGLDCILQHNTAQYSHALLNDGDTFWEMRS